ncbi:MAG: hypothetical protein BGO98_11345 [Myxococcales bacterium 68-20]|nr:hypothetical protein [Myxococcales bacterium]OJY16782.1 MAG: hypothetical protein BGO98_11345 [Myxococcales bacterium 68-20]
MSPYRQNAKPPSDESLPEFRPKGSLWDLPIPLFFIFGPSLVILLAPNETWALMAAFVRPGMIAVGLGVMVARAARKFLAVRRARREAGWR